jgi:hypothetical protein
MTVEQIAAVEGPARLSERQAIIAYIRKRAASALNISKRSPDRLTEADAKRLERWLEALARDIDQQLHDEADE